MYRKEICYDRFWGRMQRNETGCMEWQGYRDSAGYGQVRVGGKLHKTHRLAFELTYGFAPEVVRHRCDNPSCCNPEHLLDGTHQDNVGDRVVRGRTRTGHIYGELNNFAKLTLQQVQDIRTLHEEGVLTQSEIAQLFHIHQTQVSNIVRRKHWKEVA